MAKTQKQQVKDYLETLIRETIEKMEKESKKTEECEEECEEKEEGKKDFKKKKKEDKKSELEEVYKILSDDQLLDIVVERELREMTGTGSLSTSDTPANIDDLDADVQETEPTDEEEINLDEARKILGLVLEESFEASGQNFPSFETSVSLINKIFNTKVPSDFYKILREDYKNKTALIIGENSHKDEYERFIL